MSSGRLCYKVCVSYKLELMRGNFESHHFDPNEPASMSLNGISREIYQVSSSHPDVVIPSYISRLGLLMQIDGHSESPLMARNHVRRLIWKNLDSQPCRRTSFVPLKDLASTVY